MSRDPRISTFVMVFFIAAMTGCSTPGGTNEKDGRFADLLVIGVAGSWNSRAQFERVVVAGLREEGVKAQSYNLIKGGRTPPSREEIVAAIEEHGFDGVVVTRVRDVESDLEVRSAVTGAKVKRKESGFGKLFRYDYEELGEPLHLTVHLQVDFVTELYDAASQELVWSAETRPPKSDNVQVLVDRSANLVVRELKRSGRLAR